MKKLISVLMLMALLTVACGEKKDKKIELSVQEKENLELVKKIEAIDSIATKIEAVKTEIEETSKELDELLNDL